MWSLPLQFCGPRPHSQEVVGDLTLVVEQVFRLGAVSVAWGKKKHKKTEAVSVVEMGAASICVSSSRTCVASVHVDSRPVVLAPTAHHVVLEIGLGHV